MARCRSSAATATSATTRSSCGCATRVLSRSWMAWPSYEPGATTMISFERPREMDERLEFVRHVASGLMREKARYYDEHEHEIPWEVVNLMWERQLRTADSFRRGARLPSDGTGVVAQTLV